MKVHLQLKTMVSGTKGYRGPMVNVVCHHLHDSRREAKGILAKV